MGKASSNKKVARAAKAGGGKARAAGERNLLFPAALVVVVVLGTLLVVYARENRSAEALEPPLLSDHWHSSYGFYVCDEFLPPMPEYTAPQNGGNHTHGDGLIHIHPFSSARAGENANLGNWMLDAGVALGNEGGISDDELHVPDGETYTEGDDSCEGLDGDPIVQVAFWETGRAALDEEDPVIITEGLDDIRFAENGQAFTIAFAPEGADIPPPPSTSELSSVGADLGVPEDSIPVDAEQPGAEDPAATDPAGETDPTGETDTTAATETDTETDTAPAETDTTDADQ